jgi:hypothetical protein
MACHWHKLPDGSVMHFNMATLRKRRCAHCDCRDAKALCDWPMVVAKRIKSIDDLNVDDVITQSHGWRARILSITLGPPAERFSCRSGWYMRLAVLNTGLNITSVRWLEIAFTFDLWAIERLRVERPGTCDKPCCFRCRRHIGPDRDYCMDHWDLQVPAVDVAPRAALPGARVRSGRTLDRLKQRRLFE